MDEIFTWLVIFVLGGSLSWAFIPSRTTRELRVRTKHARRVDRIKELQKLLALKPDSDWLLSPFVDDPANRERAGEVARKLAEAISAVIPRLEKEHESNLEELRYIVWQAVDYSDSPWRLELRYDQPSGRYKVHTPEGVVVDEVDIGIPGDEVREKYVVEVKVPTNQLIRRQASHRAQEAWKRIEDHMRALEEQDG